MEKQEDKENNKLLTEEEMEADQLVQNKKTGRGFMVTIFPGIENTDLCEVMMGKKMDKLVDDGVARYCCWQFEECPETKKVHIQAYIEVLGSMRPSALRQDDKLGKCYVVHRRGTRDDARAYCMKQKTRLRGPFEAGVWTGGQGTRTDLKKLQSDIKDGQEIKIIAENHFGAFLKYNKAIDRYYSMIGKKEQRKSMDVIWIWGTPGTGKSRMAWMMDTEAYWLPAKGYGGTTWFDGYEGQETLVIDDYNNNFQRGEMLRILDTYPLMVQVKGGMRDAQWTRVIITSNDKPNVDDKAMERRINKLIEFRRVGEVVLVIYDKMKNVTCHDVTGNNIPSHLVNCYKEIERINGQ